MSDEELREMSDGFTVIGKIGVIVMTFGLGIRGLVELEKKLNILIHNQRKGFLNRLFGGLADGVRNFTDAIMQPIFIVVGKLMEWFGIALIKFDLVLMRIKIKIKEA